MNNTSNSDHGMNNPSEEHNGSYAYYSVGLSLGILLMIALISLISFYCSHRSLQNSQVSVTANTSMELDSALTIQVHQQNSFVNNYPVLLFSEAKHHRPDSETMTSSCCSICLADYKDTDCVKLLSNCGHLFHIECIDRWLQVNLSCPMCRNSPLPSPLSTPLAEATPLVTRRD